MKKEERLEEFREYKKDWTTEWKKRKEKKRSWTEKLESIRENNKNKTKNLT